MSELKARTTYDVYWDEQDTNVLVYLKSEADKVIAELEMKLAIAQQVLRLNKPEALYSNLETMSRLTHEKYVIERRERHHKYKRCLAMAKWCKTSAQFDKVLGVFKYRDWFWKWFKRWMKLAEKFKPNNNRPVGQRMIGWKENSLL